jgi:hypothetical protein
MQSDKKIKMLEQEFHRWADNLYACVAALADRKPDAEAKERIKKEAMSDIESLELIFSLTHTELIEARKQPEAWAFPAKSN